MSSRLRVGPESRRSAARGPIRTTPRGVVLVFRVHTVHGSRSIGFAAPPSPFARWTMAYSRLRLSPAWYGRVRPSRGLAPSLRDLRSSSGPSPRGSRLPRVDGPTSHEVHRPFSAPTRRIDVEKPPPGAGSEHERSNPAQRPKAPPCRRTDDGARRCPTADASVVVVQGDRVIIGMTRTSRLESLCRSR
jgi:hypothetical protein